MRCIRILVVNELKKISLIVVLATVLLASLVYSQSHVPIKGAAINVYGDNGEAYVTTGADGSFTISSGLGEGTYTVEVYAKGYISKVLSNVKIEAGKVKDLGDIILEASGVIKGKVVSPDGNPVKGVLVTLMKGNKLINSTTTSFEGAFVFDTNLDTGTYSIIVLPAGYSSIEFKTVNIGMGTIQIPVVKEGGAFVQGYVTTKKDSIKVTKGKVTETKITLGLSGIISGKVTDKQGNPIKGVVVLAFNVEKKDVFEGFWAVTNDNGEYRIANNLGTGKYNVTLFNPKGYIWRYMMGKQVNVVAGKETPNVNFQLEKSGIISGKVQWSDGSPVPYAVVFASSKDGKYFGYAQTDINGNFRIDSGLGTGDYIVVASKGTAFTMQPVQVHVEAGKEKKNVIVKIKGNVVVQAVIKGKVTDKQGKPLAGAEVSGGGNTTVTDADGNYMLVVTLYGKSSSEMEITALKRGYKKQVKKIKVEAGGTYTLDFQLEALPSGILKGRVLGVSAVAKKKAQLLLVLSSTNVQVGSSITISGQLTPARPGKVTIYYSFNGSSYTELASVSLSNGKYSYQFKPNKNGVYKFKAVWPGDSEYEQATSDIKTLTVIKAAEKVTPTVSISLSKTTATVGDSITVSGSITPFKGPTKVIIVVMGPGGPKQYEVTSTNGKFSYSFKVGAKGVWKVKALIPVSERYNKASSNEVTVNVQEAAQKKKCIIATVTFGSEVSPEVNFLRGFRDNLILETFSGRRFYVAFDTFYYSWSTPVAMYIEGHPYLKGMVKLLLYPLLGVLKITVMAVMPWFNMAPEIATITAGFIASSLLGLVYVLPIALLVHLIRAKYGKAKPVPGKVVKTNGYLSLISLIALGIGVLILNPWLTTLSSLLFVLSNISLASVATLYFLERKKIIK